MIKETKPYILYLVNNSDEFTELQHKLFSIGYKWLNGVHVNNNFVNILEGGYPLYISNLPYIIGGVANFNLSKRKTYNEYENNILFIDKYKESFDIVRLRRDKIKKLNNI